GTLDKSFAEVSLGLLFDVGGAPVNSLVVQPDGKVLVGGWFHYVNDPIGTPERLVAIDGSVACELRRKAWGETEAAPKAKASTALRFQGQYEDEETGLCYNRFRYYDQDTKRYISADPLGLHAGYNDYCYPSPLASADPLGLAPTLPNISMRHDQLAHGGYYTRKAQRIAANKAEVSDHGGKHLKARTCRDAKSMSAGGGAAQYYPGVDHAAQERTAIAKGEVIRGEPIQAVLHGQTFHTKYDAKTPLGAFGGTEVSTMRAEYTPPGVIHGHPRKF
ncbi:MAG: RHS repeat-associated core domain-containing protein, partial [Byssovorax sp.]